jgi:hypothetical protein
MLDRFSLAKTMTPAELWQQIEGFTPPNCPECGKPAELDDDGYWCIHCSDAAVPNPAVDSIPNGAEFDAYLDAWRQATERAKYGPRAPGERVAVTVEDATMHVSTIERGGKTRTRVEARGAETIEFDGDVPSYDAAVGYYDGFDPTE